MLILPGKKNSLVPIVGVSDAANVFNAALSKNFSKMEICGVYREDSPTTADFTKLISFKIFKILIVPKVFTS